MVPYVSPAWVTAPGSGGQHRRRRQGLRDVARLPGHDPAAHRPRARGAGEPGPSARGGWRTTAKLELPCSASRRRSRGRASLQATPGTEAAATHRCPFALTRSRTGHPRSCRSGGGQRVRARERDPHGDAGPHVHRDRHRGGLEHAGRALRRALRGHSARGALRFTRDYSTAQKTDVLEEQRSKGRDTETPTFFTVQGLHNSNICLNSPVHCSRRRPVSDSSGRLSAGRW